MLKFQKRLEKIYLECAVSEFICELCALFCFITKKNRELFKRSVLTALFTLLTFSVQVNGQVDEQLSRQTGGISFGLTKAAFAEGATEASVSVSSNEVVAKKVISNEELIALFPTIDELPGGSNHWVSSTSGGELLEVSGGKWCTVYSATYAYFTQEAKPLFDIPRSNVYSVNMRIHECDSMNVSSELYANYSKVGDDDHKRLVGMGDKGLLYFVPSSSGQYFGDYYLTTLSKYIVLQVHSDDGFVLMDMGSLMSGRIDSYLRIAGNDVSTGLTLSVEKEGYRKFIDLISFSADGVEQVKAKGVVYDQNNVRVAGAKITALETGEVFYTNDRGEFSINIGAKNGKAAEVYRVLTAERVSSYGVLDSGYYLVDIEYKSNDKVSQDSWKLYINSKGDISGTSYNHADQNTLSVSGKLVKDEITIDRPCGGSTFGVCMQKFKGTLRDDIFTGDWKGTGGGGGWKLYKNSYNYKEIIVTMEEAGYESLSKGEKGKGYILSDSVAYEFKPLKSEHDDFFISSVALQAEVVSGSVGKEDKEISKLLYLYGAEAQGSMSQGMMSQGAEVGDGVGGDQRAKVGIEKSGFVQIGSTPQLTISHTPVKAGIDITANYRYSAYSKYLLGFNAVFSSSDGVAEQSKGSSGAVADMSITVTPHVAIKYATAGVKGEVSGAIDATLISYAATDMVGSSKVIAKDGKKDLALKVNVSAYGGILQNIKVATQGKAKRAWSTSVADVSPGVGVFVSGRDAEDLAGINFEDGSLMYPLRKLEEELTLYISMGSLIQDDIEAIQITLTIDGVDVTRSINVR